MDIINLEIHNEEVFVDFIVNNGQKWSQDFLEKKLDALQKASKKRAWIREDLSTSKSTLIGRIFWSIAKSFNWTRRLFYHVDLDNSKKILENLEPQIRKLQNAQLQTLFDKAILNFNSIAPKHAVVTPYVFSLMPQKNRHFYRLNYKSPAARDFPPILKRNLNKTQTLYPQEFEIKIAQWQKNSDGSIRPALLKDLNQEDPWEYEKLSKRVFDDVAKMCKPDLKKGRWDIHDTRFQNLALKLTKDFAPEAIKKELVPKKGNEGRMHLMRARTYAIASRNDLDWNGHSIANDPVARQKKQKEMEANWHSIVLRDWGGISEDKLSKEPGKIPEKISVTNDDTQTAIEKLAKNYSADKLAFINMANAHRTGGGYQKVDTAQEEVIVTNSDAVVTLGNLAEIDPKNGRATYKKHWHIPPGGNYFHKMRFVTGGQVTCNTIAHAFADLRKDLNKYPESEYADFKNPSAQTYQERIKLDMRGVLRTAKEEKQEALVLSATGCGAFEHDPQAEAKAWKEVLQEDEFRNHFKEIVFAIIQGKKKNYDIFKKEIGEMTL